MSAFLRRGRFSWDHLRLRDMSVCPVSSLSLPFPSYLLFLPTFLSFSPLPHHLLFSYYLLLFSPLTSFLVSLPSIPSALPALPPGLWASSLMLRVLQTRALSSSQGFAPTFVSFIPLWGEPGSYDHFHFTGKTLRPREF